MSLPHRRRVRTPALLALALALLASPACKEEDDDDTTAPPAPPWSAGDAATLAPPEGNSMGLYAMAVCPGRDRLYYTNLHHPSVGVVDVSSGTLADTFDLRTVTGGLAPVFPFVACHPDGDGLLVNDRRGGTVIRVDPDTGSVIQVEPVCSDPGWIEPDAVTGDVWVACAADRTLVRLDGVTLAPTDTVDLGEVIPVRVQLAASRLYVIDEAGQRMAVVDPEAGAVLGAVEIPGRPNMVARWGTGQLYVTERLGGHVMLLEDGDPPVVHGHVDAGSDPFGILAMPDRNRLYVVARQGAEVTLGDPYRGEPGLLLAMDLGGAVTHETEVGKTPHFVLPHPHDDLLLVGNEDSLDVTAVGPDHQVAWTTPPLGLTLDDAGVDAVGGRLWFPSHLSDEVWVHDADTGEATRLEVPWWPFAAAVDEDARRVYVASHQRDALRAYDADTLALLDEWTLGVDSHALPCAPLCTGHPIATDVAVDPGRGWVYVSHPPSAAVLRVDAGSGDVTEISLESAVEAGPEDKFQHMALAVDPGDGRLFVYYGLDDRLLAVDGDSVAATATVDSLEPRPLSLDGDRDRVLLGRQVLDRDLAEVGSAPEGLELVAVLADPDRYLARDTDRLVLLDPDSLEETASFSLDGLQVPPFGMEDPTTAGVPRSSPVLAVPLDGGPLVLVINVFEGAFEIVDARDW